MKHRTLLLAALLFLTSLLYLPTLDDPPLNWDDPEYIELPLLEEPDALLQIWTSFATPQAYPVLFTSFWLDRTLWGGSIPATRGTNMVLHGLVAVLAFLFFREILNREGAAFFGALLFAVHPTQVATVAWIAERKNLLVALFLLLSLIAYRRAARGVEERRSRLVPWGATYAFGLLAMLSKSSAVVLPLLILWMEACLPTDERPATEKPSSVAPRTAVSAKRDGRHRWQSILPWTLPFFLFAALQSGLTLFREHGPAITTDASAVERIAIAARGLWFYLGKLVWPSGLSPMYPRWELDSSMLVLGALALAGLLLVTILLLGALRSIIRNKASSEGTMRVLVFGLGFFVIANLPTLGLVPFGYMEKSFVADHFLYVPALGFWIAVCALGQFLAGRLGASRLARIGAVAAPVLIALTWGAMTMARLPHWSDSEAFWSRAIETSPRSWVAWGNRGEFRARGGRWSESRSDLERALEIRPDYPEARFNLGYVLDRQGDLAGAREQYERVVALSPNFAEAHLNLGIVLARQGDRVGTRREIEAARSLDADIPVPPSIEAWLRETGSP